MKNHTFGGNVIVHEANKRVSEESLDGTAGELH